MSCLYRIQKAIDYIEENLEDDIVLEDVASIAGFSLFHFHRIFQTMVGDSMKDYIRIRRLSNAAHELLNTKTKILDIAMKHRYESQESFSRAFKKVFGMTPGKYRKQTRHFILAEKMNLLEKVHNLQEDFVMEPKILYKSEFNIVGMEYHGSNNIDVFYLWGQLWPRVNEIRNQTNSNCALGVTFLNPQKGNNGVFSYVAGVEVDSINDIPEGMVVRVVPPEKYAVFTHKGRTCKMPGFINRIYDEWLPEFGYEPTMTLEIVLLDERFTGSNPSSELDIYIPIRQLNKNV